jgi:hypothetical protein
MPMRSQARPLGSRSDARSRERNLSNQLEPIVADRELAIVIAASAIVLITVLL